MSTSWAGIPFPASGEARLGDNPRRAVYWRTQQSFGKTGLNCWPSGYAGVFLAEYYPATGDQSVLPKLQGLCDFLSSRQMACGSWGHDAPHGGYGAVNRVGVVCFMAMVLVKESETSIHEGCY